MIVISFIVCLVFFAAIGIASIVAKRNNTQDYLLAGRSLNPAIAGLSAVATTNSGFMFTGWIGLSYATGISAIWFMLGLGSGTLFGLFKASKSIRKVSEARDVLTYGGLLSRWQGTDYKWLRIITGLIILVFLSTYAAAQLTAGGKALHVLLDWNYETGAILGSGIILLYCFSGGLRASVWTDVAQSIVMFIAMGVLFFYCLIALGGFGVFWSQLGNIDSALTNFVPQTAHFGPLLYIGGWFAAGIGILGQPHIIVRFMSLDSADNTKKSLMYYMVWYILFFVMSFLVGLMARVLIPDVGNFDPELALPMIALDLLPEVLVGIILAGLFAASMSTADSLVLSCSASLTRDLKINDNASTRLTKAGTMFVTLFTLSIALWGNKSVFVLVIFAWAALASSFAPLIVLYLLNQKPSQTTACFMMLAGLSAASIWHYLGLQKAIPEALPGMAAGFIAYFLGNYSGPLVRFLLNAVGIKAKTKQQHTQIDAV
jgi:sodium/proline symporter